MSHVEQSQFHCNRCVKPTLHTRLVQPFNHTVHALIILLCCGCWWIPVWLLMWSTHKSRNDPWRCATCGQLVGQMTAEQEHTLIIHRAQEDATRAHWDAIEQSAKAEEREAIREKRKQQLDAVGSVISRQAQAAWEQLKTLPRLYDRAIWIVSGEEDNNILYWFLHFLIPALCIGIVGFMLYSAFAAIFG